MKKILWKMYFWIINISIITLVISAWQDNAKHILAYLVDIFILLSYSFTFYAFVYRKINMKLLYWEVMLWINVGYYFLYMVYEIAPTTPTIKYLSVLSENGKPDPWNDVFLELLLILPIFYAIFKLSRGFSLAVKEFEPREFIAMFVSWRNFYSSIIRWRNILKIFFKKLSKTKKILLGTLFIIILFLGSAFGYSRYLLWQAQEQMPSLDKVLDNFLTYESHKEYKKAYNLFSNEYKQYEDVDTFINMSEYTRPEIAGYLSRGLYLDDFWINFFIGQPISLTYKGHMFYEDGEDANVEATFVLVNNKWELYAVHIIAPKSRFERFTPPQEKDSL